MGKYTKTVFTSSDSRSRGVLDLIHFDLCGPMSVVSLRGFEYCVTFIDDHSKKTWIYFMESKKSEEVLQRIQEFKALVENQTGKKIGLSDRITGVSIPPRSSMSIADRRAFRGS